MRKGRKTSWEKTCKYSVLWFYDLYQGGFDLVSYLFVCFVSWIVSRITHKLLNRFQ